MKRRKNEDPAGRLCEVFFEDLLPGYLDEMALAGVTAEGTLQVTVICDRRRTWTVDLARRVVHRGGTPNATARLDCRADELLLMIFGEISWEECVIHGCVGHHGNRAVTAGFFGLLAALPPVPVQRGDPTMIN